MSIQHSERTKIINTILEIVWGLSIWQIITTLIDSYRLSADVNIIIYLTIFITVTLIIYIFNNKSLTPIYTNYN